mgnify:FL=1
MLHKHKRNMPHNNLDALLVFSPNNNEVGLVEPDNNDVLLLQGLSRMLFRLSHEDAKPRNESIPPTALVGYSSILKNDPG